MPKITKKGSWKPWFAWHPVKLHGQWMWLKPVFRRLATRYGGDNGTYKTWEYADIFDVIGE